MYLEVNDQVANYFGMKHLPSLLFQKSDGVLPVPKRGNYEFKKDSIAIFSEKHLKIIYRKRLCIGSINLFGLNQLLAHL